MPELRPKVLCVDDDPNILEALKRTLRRKFDVEVASSGELGLTALENQGPFTVVVSDMRMPHMDGSQFLSAAKQRFPDTVRILLTGYSEAESAIRAVNDGNIFRFLCKPCPPDTLSAAIDAAVEQHRLRGAERELLESTLRGSIDALAEVLSLACPLAFGRARRIQRTAVQLAQALELPDVWQVEVAAVLSQLGAVTLPHEVLERWESGVALSHEEREMVAGMPRVAEQLLERIPRLEQVRQIIQRHALAGSADRAASAPVGARILRISSDLDTLVSQGLNAAAAVDVLESRGCDPVLIEKLHGIFGRSEGGSQVREVALRMLTAGMVLDQDLRTQQGMLLVARGHVVSESLLLRLRNLEGSHQLPKFVRVTYAR